MCRGKYEAAKFVAPWAGVEVLDISIDRNLDVVVRHREKNKISKSFVRYDDYNERYFYAARQRIYLSDLKKAIYAV